MPKILDDFRLKVRNSAYIVASAEKELQDHHFSPSEKACKFCKAKAHCAALAEHVMSTVADDFVDVSKPITDATLNSDRMLDIATVANLMKAIPLIESFCTGIRARVETELLAGNTVPGYKLVEGRRGHRKWRDSTEAASTMIGSGVPPDDIYETTVIGPADAEKKFKKTFLWESLKPLIIQSAGSPSVAPESDKRPAITVGVGADAFDDVSDLL